MTQDTCTPTTWPNDPDDDGFPPVTGRQRDLVAWLRGRTAAERPELWRSLAAYYATSSPRPAVSTSTLRAVTALFRRGLVDVTGSVRQQKFSRLPRTLADEHQLLLRLALTAEGLEVATRTTDRAHRHQQLLRLALRRRDRGAAEEAVEFLAWYASLEADGSTPPPHRHEAARGFWHLAHHLAHRPVAQQEVGPVPAVAGGGRRGGRA